MKKYIFLDIDGVLNHEQFYDEYEPEVRLEYRKKMDDEWGDMFCPKSTALYNKLTDLTGAITIISSTKRSIGRDLEYMKEMWRTRGFTGELEGITPYLSVFDHKTRTYATDMSIPRGCEIDMYLTQVLGYRSIFWSKEEQQKYIEKAQVDNFIIIDDDSDVLYNQRNHFVHVLPSPRHRAGFNEKYFSEALEKLSKTTIELNYDN